MWDNTQQFWRHVTWDVLNNNAFSSNVERTYITSLTLCFSILENTGLYCCMEVLHWRAGPMTPYPSSLQVLWNNFKSVFRRCYKAMGCSNCCPASPAPALAIMTASEKIRTCQSQKKRAKRKDWSVLTYLLGDATLQTGGVQWVWNLTEGERIRRKTKKIEKISDFLHPWQSEWKEPGEKQSKFDSNHQAQEKQTNKQVKIFPISFFFSSPFLLPACSYLSVK